MADDPWVGLAPPSDPASINARRVDAAGRWHFYWGCDSQHRCLLVLRHGPESAPREKLPQLRGIEVFGTTAVGDDRPSVVFRLLEAKLRDVFLTLCRDIIDSANRSRSEREAVEAAVVRTWRWHHLLRGGGTGRMSPEEQKGLIGELLVLERYVLGAVPPVTALNAWRGPLGSAKDFVLGSVCIESKARSAALAAEALIHSEQQLDDSGIDGLYLHVSVVDPTVRDDAGGFTVTDVARRLRESILKTDSHAAEHFDALLAAAGFSFEDDYSEWYWRGGERGVYQVTREFPRLTPTQLPPGVARVSYSVSLSECEAYLVGPQDLDAAIRASANAG